MKKAMTGLIVGIAVLALTESVQAAGWQGGSGAWETDNWNLEGGYPGDASHPAEAAYFLGSGTQDISISSDLTTSGNIILNDNSGSTTTVSQTAGNVTFSSGDQGVVLFQYQTSSAASSVTWDLSGGELNITQRYFQFGRNHETDTRRGTATLNVSGNSTLYVYRDINLFAENSNLIIDASEGTTITAGSSTGYGINMDCPRTSATTYSFNSLVQVSGYNAGTSLTAGTMDAFQGQYAQGENGTASSIVKFILDENGVNAWNITGDLDLGDGETNAKGDLIVDVSDLFGAYSVDLFNYGTLTNGLFGDVNIWQDGKELTLGSAVTDAADLEMGYYYLDYGDTSSDSITLFYSSIPEPASALLLLLGGAAFLRRRRRRA